MNFVLPEQQSPALERRADTVIAEVQLEVELCQRQSSQLSGFLTRSTPEGKTWAHLESGRCRWLLIIEGNRERVIYYRQRGNEDHFELHLPSHGGGSLYQTVLVRDKKNQQYSCAVDCRVSELERRVRWFQLQRWLQDAKELMKMGRPFPRVL